MATFSYSRPKLSDFYTLSHKGYTLHSGMSPQSLHLGELCSPPNDPNPKNNDPADLDTLYDPHFSSCQPGIDPQKI